MSPFLQFALLISMLLVFAKVAGYLSMRVNQPSVLGELIVGVIIGPSLVNILHFPIFESHLEETLHFFSEIGVLLLMFVAGLELHFSELLRSSRVSAFAGSLGVFIPVVLGVVVGRIFGLDLNQSMFLGLTLGATSVSISVQTLLELNVLRSKVGLGLLGAAVFDDILVILLLSLFLALGTGNGNLASILIILARMVVFLLLSITFGWWILPKLVRKIARLSISEGVLALALAVLLIYGVASEVVGGMAAITGSFLAGLMFSRSPEKERLERGMHALSYGVFVPIFFISIGLSVNIRDLKVSDLGLVAVVCVVAIVGKLLGAGFGARLAGFSSMDSLRLGTGMISRGEVGLILATVGIDAGFMDSAMFSIILAMVLLTTIVTPPSLRALFRTPDRNPSDPKLESLEKESI